MKASEILRAAMSEKGVTQKQLAMSIGAKSQSVVAERLRTNTFTVANLNAMLEALGYELVVQPKKPGRRPDGQFVIDASEE